MDRGTRREKKTGHEDWTQLSDAPNGVKKAVSRHQVWQESLRPHNQNVIAGHSPRKVESLTWAAVCKGLREPLERLSELVR